MTVTLQDAHKQFLPLPPVLRSNLGARSPESANLVLAQFNVGLAPRYAPRDGVTFCNIFVWDVAAAFGVQLPHWLTLQGEPADKPGPPARETTANELRDRLVAGAWGWEPMEAIKAAQNAARGCPTIAIWRNHTGPGHVAWLEPTSDAADIEVAQAGSICGRDIPLAAAFGKHRIPQVLFFGQG